MPDLATEVDAAFEEVVCYAVLVNHAYPPFERSARVACKVVMLDDGPCLVARVECELNVPPCTGVLICSDDAAPGHAGHQLIWQPLEKPWPTEVGVLVAANPKVQP